MRNLISFASEDFQQKQDQDNGEDQAESAASVVTPTGAYAVAAITESKDEHQQKDDQQHVVPPWQREDSHVLATAVCGLKQLSVQPMSTRVPNAQSSFDSRLDATANVHGCIVTSQSLSTRRQIVQALVFWDSSHLCMLRNNLHTQHGVQG
jgi:hypothetical protein